MISFLNLLPAADFKYFSLLRASSRVAQDHKEINKYMQYLQSISGVGFITAVTVLGKIGNPKHLKNVRELSAFVGLVPTEFSTGDTISKGFITHLGNKTLRFLLIEAT
jgi:transposase